MNTFKLTVASPDGNKFSGEVVKLDLRGVEGDFAIMAGHIPFVTSVVKCQCVIHLEDDTQLAAETEGGLLTVDKGEVTFLSGSFRMNE